MHLTLSVEWSQVSQRQERGKPDLSHLNHMQGIAVYRREPFSEETSLQRALMPQSLTWGGLPGRQQDGSKGAAAPCGDCPGSRLMLKSHPCSPQASPCSAAQSHTFIRPWMFTLHKQHRNPSQTCECHSLQGQEAGGAESLFITNQTEVTLQALCIHPHDYPTPRKGQWCGQAPSLEPEEEGCKTDTDKLRYSAHCTHLHKHGHVHHLSAHRAQSAQKGGRV